MVGDAKSAVNDDSVVQVKTKAVKKSDEHDVIIPLSSLSKFRERRK